MKRPLLAALLCLIGQCGALAADTDGDGLLDLLDVPGFDANARGQLNFADRGIEDLDGANLLTRAGELWLAGNQITSIESGDFTGLGNLTDLYLSGNQITSIESGDFTGLGSLTTLCLDDNQITSIESGDFTGLGSLTTCICPPTKSRASNRATSRGWAA